ncbi:MAG: MFS transporter [Gemmatimonadaceae bacterium]
MTLADSSQPPATRRALAWIPTLYFAQGFPYALVMTVSVVMYKRLGVSNSAIAFVTSWLYLPWVIKPLWSPLVDLRRTRRWWTLVMQWTGAAAVFGIAIALQTPAYVALSLAVFAVMAFASATHDIACDGFYMLALPQREQAAYVGLRSTFYRIAMIVAQGAFVVLAGLLEIELGNEQTAWSLAMAAGGTLFVLLATYHAFVLPRPASDRDRANEGAGSRSAVFGDLGEWREVFASFFAKPGIGGILAFLLFYRFAEAQLVKLVTPFLLDARATGGLGLSTTGVGMAYGTIGVAALLVGGILGGLAGARWGLKRILWFCVLALHVPDVVFLALATYQPEHFGLISAALAVEQFGYGFGFAAYVMFLLYLADGPHRTAHYAIATGIMALGMMIPGMFAGAIQQSLGYRGFFVWVLVSTVPGFIAPALVTIDPSFGRGEAA